MKDTIGRWVTVKGTAIFIKDGQTLSQAFKENIKKKPILTKLQSQKIQEKEKELKEKGIDVKGFERYSYKFRMLQYNAIEEQISKCDNLGKYIKKYGLDVNVKHLKANGGGRTATWVSKPTTKLLIELNENLEDKVESIKNSRMSGKHVSREQSFIPDEQYVITHEIGHLKEQLIYQNFLEEKGFMDRVNIRVKEYAKESSNQIEFKKKCQELKDQLMIMLFQEHGILNINELKISEYAKTNRSETIAEYNLIYSNPQRYNRIMKMDKMFEEIRDEKNRR